MKALVFDNPSSVVWKELPDSVLQEPYGVVLQPIVIAPCSSDAHTVYGGGKPKQENHILGHDCVARVVASQVRDFKIGDVVAVPALHRTGAPLPSRKDAITMPTTISQGIVWAALGQECLPNISKWQQGERLRIGNRHEGRNERAKRLRCSDAQIAQMLQPVVLRGTSTTNRLRIDKSSRLVLYYVVKFKGK